jgi:hypothetical protein
LQARLHEGELREYLFADYLVLYVQFDEVIHLLSIKHHRQLSFDFQMLWPESFVAWMQRSGIRGRPPRAQQLIPMSIIPGFRYAASGLRGSEYMRVVHDVRAHGLFSFIICVQ